MSPSIKDRLSYPCRRYADTLREAFSDPDGSKRRLAIWDGMIRKITEDAGRYAEAEAAEFAAELIATAGRAAAPEPVQ